MDVLGWGWERGVEGALSRPLQAFLAAHPLLGWLLNHPLWGVGVLLLVLLLGLGLLSAIARLTENFWLTLGQMPLRLLVWLLGAAIGLLRRPWRAKTGSAASAQSLPKSPDRAAEIALRLAALQTEQAALVRELQSLLQEPPPK